jgi:hypothetical protein
MVLKMIGRSARTNHQRKSDVVDVFVYERERERESLCVCGDIERSFLVVFERLGIHH